MEAREVGLERRVSDEQGRVVVRQHFVEVRRGRVEPGLHAKEVVEEDARHRGGRARRDVESDGLRGLERLAAHEDDAAHALAGRDSDSADDPNARDARGLDRRHEPRFDLPAREAVGARGRDVRERLDALHRAPQEPPRERPGVDVVHQRCAQHVVHSPPKNTQRRPVRGGLGDNEPCPPPFRSPSPS